MQAYCLSTDYNMLLNHFIELVPLIPACATDIRFFDLILTFHHLL